MFDKIIHIHSPNSDEVKAMVAASKAAVEAIKEARIEMSDAMNTLRREVAESRTVTESALTAFTGISARLQTALDNLAAKGVEEAELTSLAADLNQQQELLAAAVAASTYADPAAPAPMPEPPLPSPEVIVQPLPDPITGEGGAPAPEPAPADPAAPADPTTAEEPAPIVEPPADPNNPPQP